MTQRFSASDKKGPQTRVLNVLSQESFIKTGELNVLSDANLQTINENEAFDFKKSNLQATKYQTNCFSSKTTRRP